MSVAAAGRRRFPPRKAIGSNGFVLGVDLAENLLELARTKAKQRGLTNLEFRTGDMLDLGLPEIDFDAVICVFAFSSCRICKLPRAKSRSNPAHWPI